MKHRTHSSRFVSLLRKSAVGLTLLSATATTVPACLFEQGNRDQRDRGADFETDETGEIVSGSIEINQRIQVGTFMVDLGTFHFYRDTGLVGEPPRFELDFRAENLSEKSEHPFDGDDGDHLILEIDGKFLSGNVETDRVPGLRTGAGVISWQDLGFSNLVSLGAVFDGVITIGGLEENYASLPLAEPAAISHFPSVSIGDFPTALNDIFNCDVRFDAATLSYHSKRFNDTLDAGKAELQVQGSLSGQLDLQFGSQYWGDDDLVILRPDGLTSTATLLNEVALAGQTADFDVYFELAEPISGTYTITARQRGEEVSATFEIP